MTETWRAIRGYEDRYHISSLGRVKSLEHFQRYLRRDGQEGYRRVPERILKQHRQNSGYLLVWLWLDNKQQAISVHRLVARAFVAGSGETVNHIDGRKTNNKATNLEWISYSENHLHAVKLRLNRQARRVMDPATGAIYESIAQAAIACRLAHRTVRRRFVRV